MTDAYWQIIDAQLKALRSIGTVTEVLALCAMPGVVGDGFWGGGGDDMLEALYEAGWHHHAYKAPYLWTVRQPDGGECLSYCEGDLYREAP